MSASFTSTNVNQSVAEVALHEEVHDRTIAPPASSEPMRAANTPSSTNGVWMNRFDAPTSRMMPSSRRREKAERRIVVAISSAAATSMSAAIAMAV